jgi:hypothetical protein
VTSLNSLSGRNDQKDPNDLNNPSYQQPHTLTMLFHSRADYIVSPAALCRV